MYQPPLIQPSSLSVTEITTYLRTLLESDPILQDVWVAGEISNLSRPASGHIYFTLKDAGAAIKCVIWRSAAARISGNLQVGSQIEAHGQISLYERDSNCQLYVNAIRMRGEGELYQEFLRLKAWLEAEGYFDEDRKRQLPALPQKIGIVTSGTGAALQDMLNTLKGRYCLAEVIIAPTAVQGVDAPHKIIQAISRLNREIKPDVILVARGGGSMEDLWAFNDEGVVRAIADSESPVVTGIGHETDFTLADFSADVRAPTPTGAAVAATPAREDMSDEVERALSQLTRFTQSLIRIETANLNQIIDRVNRESPLRRVGRDRQIVDAFASRITVSFTHHLAMLRQHTTGTNNRLQSLNPQSILKRGYALVRLKDGTLVKNARQLTVGVVTQSQFAHGSAESRVESISQD